MKLFIDPGHGQGNRSPGVWDPGAVSGGVSEADVAYAWSLTLKHILAEKGIQAVLSRPTDSTESPLRYRVMHATELGCSHLVSLHCNAGVALARGVETFYRYDSSWVRAVHHAAVSAVRSRDRGMFQSPSKGASGCDLMEGTTAMELLPILEFQSPSKGASGCDRRPPRLTAS